MIRFNSAVMIVASALFISACASCKATPLRPAILSNANESAQQTLTQAMQKLANKSVRLPSQAFIQSPQLALVDKVDPSPSNPKGLGMEHLPPHRFELQSNGKDCWLAYLNTQEKIKLTGISCSIIPE